MCGIFGFWLKRPLIADDLARGRRGTKLLGHRGPDGTGEWFDSGRGLYFGHRRLAIIDVNARSDQPMSRAGNVIAYNGEIYNFSELRGELTASGSSFETTGDTEVLLAAWSEWGEGALDRFDGMFAFAISGRDDLVLATDPFGEKPFYVATTEDGIWFSSEPQPLIEILDLEFRPDAEEIRLFLSLGFLPPPHTGFARLEVMPPATIRRYGRTLSFKDRRYWQVPEGATTAGPIAPLTEQNVDDVAHELLVSLKRRLRSDVPIGLFLSSGVDSSLIAALCARELGVSLNAYTVSFPDGVDEAPAAGRIAAHLGLPHMTIDSSEAPSDSPLPAQLVDLYGVPNDNLSGLSVSRMSKAARSHVTVALSGTGGDELSYGYNKYRFLWRRRAIYQLPKAPFRLAASMPRFLHAVPFWKMATDYLAGDDLFRIISIKNGGFANEISRIGGGLPLVPLHGEDLVQSNRALDMEWTLPGSYLAAVDRGSMRAGLEVRTPFLSRGVFAKAASIDSRSLVDGPQKALLHRILSRYLPAELIETAKRGFVSPMQRYVSSLKEPPRKAWQYGDDVQSLWQQRTNSAAGNILLRVDILHRLLSSG